MTNTLLYLNFSPRLDSLSKSLADGFISQWRNTNEEANLIQHEMGRSPVHGPDDFWIKANMTPEPQRSADQRQQLDVSDKSIDDLHRASHILISTPMFNFAAPWTLKSYIDLIVRVGKTFTFDPASGFGPLLESKKKLLIIWASAGEYPAGSPSETYDHLTPYLKHVFRFMGVTEVESVNVGNQWGTPEIAGLSVKHAQQQLSGMASRW